MADTKISALTSAGTLDGTEELPVVQDGSTKGATTSQVADLVRDYMGGAGVFYRVKGSDLSEDATNFNFGVQTFEGVNADGRNNNVVSIGWNIGANGAPEDAGEAAFRLGFEEHYIQGGYTSFEYHVECTDENGDIRRVYSVFAPKDGGAGSSVTYAADIHSFKDYAGNQRMKVDLAGDAITFDGDALVLTYSQNNIAVFRQINAADDAFIALPYINADDRLHSDAKGAYFIGSTPTGGDFANRFFVIQPASLPNNGQAMHIAMPAVTGQSAAIEAQGSASEYQEILNLNVGTGHAQYRLQTLTTGGDPRSVYEIAGAKTWSAGADNSANDRFAISEDVNLGSSDRFRIEPGGQVAIPTVGKGLSIAEGSNAKMGTATLVAGEATVSTTAVTASSRIFLTGQADGGTPGAHRVSTRTAGTSFTIKSTEAADTSTVAWVIFEPA